MAENQSTPSKSSSFFCSLFVVVFASARARLKLPYPIVLVIAGLVLSFIPGIPRYLHQSRRHLPRLPAPASLLRRMVHLLARLQIQYSQHPLSCLRPRRLHRRRRRLAPATSSPASTGDSASCWAPSSPPPTPSPPLPSPIASACPQRIVDILEGESLVNDATGLLALEFGVAMVVSGQTPTVAPA